MANNAFEMMIMLQRMNLTREDKVNKKLCQHIENDWEKICAMFPEIHLYMYIFKNHCTLKMTLFSENQCFKQGL